MNRSAYKLVVIDQATKYLAVSLANMLTRQLGGLNLATGSVHGWDVGLSIEMDIANVGQDSAQAIALVKKCTA